MPGDTVAHDINNLLMIVAGCCERLMRQTALTPAQVAELERISLATSHAATLTAQLVATSRGLDPGPQQSTDLAAALGQAVRLLEHALGERIRIELTLSEARVWVPMGDGEVTQVLINLALNARDAMPNGGVLSISTIIVGNEAGAAGTNSPLPGDYVRLEVRDNGSGMDSETRARAFDRRFSTKPGGRGSGLGLASVKRVVERCGGSIELGSAPGRGTRVTMLLPVVDGGSAPESPAADEPSLHARPGETVMVAEDEPVVRDIVASILRALGYETIEVGSAEEVLKATSARRIDLLVADIDLPDVNGIELGARLATSSPGTRVLFMSGYGDEGSVPHDVLHAAMFLQKPFTGFTLGQKVRAMLDATAGAAGQR
jgi:CheY-like chemotaxis protein